MIHEMTGVHINTRAQIKARCVMLKKSYITTDLQPDCYVRLHVVVTLRTHTGHQSGYQSTRQSDTALFFSNSFGTKWIDFVICLVHCSPTSIFTFIGFNRISLNCLTLLTG